MEKCRFTKKAEQDLEAITSYTFDTWGHEQTIQYLDGLEILGQVLADNPDTRIMHELIARGLRSFSSAINGVVAKIYC